jgi:hypothetical protein
MSKHNSRRNGKSHLARHQSSATDEVFLAKKRGFRDNDIGVRADAFDSESGVRRQVSPSNGTCKLVAVSRSGKRKTFTVTPART